MSAQLNFWPMAPAKTDDTISRHRGNPQSVAANLRAEPGKASMRERIRVHVTACGYTGATSAEIEERFGIAKNRFSGRLTALRKEEIIFASRRVRGECTVFVGRRDWV